MNLTEKQHGTFDYVFGVVVTLSPWLFGFAADPFAVSLAVLLGGLTLVYSLLTHYERGIFGLIPFTIHRLLDVAVGIALVGATWHFGMKDIAGVVFTILGAISLVATALTRRPKESGTVAR